MITNATVLQPTWVVVYESANNKPARALGATVFFPNTKSGTIELLRPTVAGKTYFVGGSVDDGDFQLSFQKDQPLRDTAGNPVWVTFVAQ